VSGFGDQLLLGCFVKLVELCFYVAAYPIVQGLIALPLVEQLVHSALYGLSKQATYHTFLVSPVEASAGLRLSGDTEVFNETVTADMLKRTDNQP
jgi:hypothetical protein